MIWNRLAGNLITLFVILFHVDSLHDYRFFFEIPRFEEVQDSFSSTHREEVGRPTLGAFGGFLTTFFYQRRFGVFTQEILPVIDELQKLSLRRL